MLLSEIYSSQVIQHYIMRFRATLSNAKCREHLGFWWGPHRYTRNYTYVVRMNKENL